jgi:ABC-2 type transport system permease protein
MAGLIGAEARRIFIQTRRYPFEFASSMVVLVVVFLGLFLGASYLAGVPIRGPHLSEVVLGYVVWTVAMSAVSDMGFDLQNEAQNGTLEQVFLTPRHPGLTMLVRDAVAVAFFLVPMAVVLTVLVVITGARFTLSAFDLVPFGLALLTAWGLGLVVASAAILVKRMNQVLNLLQFALLFVIMAPIAQLTGLWHVVATVLPLEPAVGLLDHLMVPGSGPSTAVLLLEAAINAALWMAGGALLFSRADRLARARGILAHY